MVKILLYGSTNLDTDGTTSSGSNPSPLASGLFSPSLAGSFINQSAVPMLVLQPGKQTNPTGTYLQPYSEPLDDPSYTSASAAGIGNINGGSTSTGGNSYATTGPNGQPTTVTVSPEQPAVNGGASSQFSTTVNPQQGTTTVTETLSVTISISPKGLSQIFNEINTAVSSFASAVWNGISAGASAVESAVVSFGGWVNKHILLNSNVVSADLQPTKISAAGSFDPGGPQHSLPASGRNDFYSNMFNSTHFPVSIFHL